MVDAAGNMTGALSTPRGWAGTAMVLAVLLAGCVLVSLCVGRFAVSPQRAIEVLWQALLAPGRAVELMDERIVLLVRTPRVVLAALAGAALAITGAALQGVFRNPLVSPEVLGISQGAAFGA